MLEFRTIFSYVNLKKTFFHVLALRMGSFWALYYKNKEIFIDSILVNSLSALFCCSMNVINFCMDYPLLVYKPFLTGNLIYTYNTLLLQTWIKKVGFLWVDILRFLSQRNCWKLKKP